MRRQVLKYRHFQARVKRKENNNNNNNNNNNYRNCRPQFKSKQRNYIRKKTCTISYAEILLSVEEEKKSREIFPTFCRLFSAEFFLGDPFAAGLTLCSGQKVKKNLLKLDGFFSTFLKKKARLIFIWQEERFENIWVRMFWKSRRKLRMIHTHTHNTHIEKKTWNVSI